MAPHPVILVDSDILIAHLRGLEAARDWLLNARSGGPWRSASYRLLSWSAGCAARNVARHGACWRRFAPNRPPRSSLAKLGEFRRQYRRSHSGIGLGDYLIAATAEVKGYRLGTLNVKHFPMFQGLWPPLRHLVKVHVQN